MKNHLGLCFASGILFFLALTSASCQRPLAPEKGSLPGPFSVRYVHKNLGSVTLVWSESAGATNYLVKYGTTAGSYEASLVGASPLTVTGLTPGLTYYFSVAANNNAGSINVGVMAAKIPEGILAANPTGHSVCHLGGSGEVKCWGNNLYGQLGKENTESLGDGPGEMGASMTPINLGTDRFAVQMAMGAFHVCALLDDGQLKCWGQGNNGQLGQGNTAHVGDDGGEMGDSLVAVNLGTNRTAVQIAAGEAHTCALLDNGQLKCWGNNDFGQLGKGNTARLGDGPGEMGDALAPIDLGYGKTATQVIAGQLHTCVLLVSGETKCWGYNGEGQLGVGSTVNFGDGVGQMGDSLTPIELGGSPLQLFSGSNHNCALLEGGASKCWGYNEYGQLGQGHTGALGDGAGEMGNSLGAISLGAQSVAIGGGQHHTCALLENSNVKCWGYNNRGQLGRGNTLHVGNEAGEMGASLAAVDLGTGRSAISVALGANFTCGLLDNLTVKCWGDGSSGQLGKGDTENLGDAIGEMGDSLTPIDIGG